MLQKQKQILLDQEIHYLGSNFKVSELLLVQRLIFTDNWAAIKEQSPFDQILFDLEKVSKAKPKQRHSIHSDVFSNQSLKNEGLQHQLTNIKIEKTLEREEHIGVPKSQSHLLLQEKPIISKEANLDIQTSLQKSPNFGHEGQAYKNQEQEWFRPIIKSENISIFSKHAKKNQNDFLKKKQSVSNTEHPSTISSKSATQDRFFRN